MLSMSERNAIRKAIRLNGAAMVQRIEYGRYLVRSATDERVTYVVAGTAMDGSDHRCDCPAGAHGRPCWHSAAVRLRRVQEEARRQWRRLRARPRPPAQRQTAATVVPGNALPVSPARSLAA